MDASFGSKKVIMGSAQTSNAVMRGIRMRARKANAVKIKDACVFEARFCMSVRIGTKEELKAPSAKILRKNEGIFIAIRRASVSAPTPKKWETSLSRKYPRIRLIEVKKPTQKVSLKNCTRETPITTPIIVLELNICNES